MPSDKKDSRQRRMQGVVACPHCHAGLLWEEGIAACQTCSESYPVVHGIPHFVNPHIVATSDAVFQSQVMHGSSLTARLYTAGKRIVSSEYMPHDHVREFLSNVRENELVVELGSGNRRLSEAVINIDLYPFPHVDVVADIMHAPLKDGVVDAVVLDTVLEHVPEPQRVVDEIYRILKPEGRVLCLAPFVFPYHGYPKHYFNFSKDGLEHLFRRFSRREVRTNMGPTSALVNLASEYVGIAFSSDNKLLYSIGKGLALLPIFVLKYLDRLWVRSSRAANLAGVLSLWAVK
ncbi:MAG: class I SAM-dependent methyltransferase [Nitrospiraceae bacterium]|nr:class I SAM-dependent methyltransferase [Nitrospiraceae bacterium]